MDAYPYAVRVADTNARLITVATVWLSPDVVDDVRARIIVRFAAEGRTVTVEVCAL